MNSKTEMTANIMSTQIKIMLEQLREEKCIDIINQNALLLSALNQIVNAHKSISIFKKKGA